MKSFLIIGTGRFGGHLCRALAQRTNGLVIVDKNEEHLEPLLPYVVDAKIADCTNEKVLRALGVDNFDICFVCIGTDFTANIEITAQLKDMGAKHVISRCASDVQERILLRVGADEIIYPDRDVAEKCAIHCSADHVFDYIDIGDGYSICDIAPQKQWIGKTILDLDFRNKYGASIIAIRSAENDRMISNPHADYRFQKGDHLVLLGSDDEINQFL